MQKIFKRIALLLAVALSVVCMGVFASACGEKEATEFTITVYYSDGTTKVNGDNFKVVAQFCIPGEGGACYGDNPFVDANGVAKISIATLEGWKKSDEYVIHAFGTDGNIPLKGAEVRVSRANPTAKLILDVTAP